MRCGSASQSGQKRNCGINILTASRPFSILTAEGKGRFDMKIGIFFDHLRVASDQTGLPLDKVVQEAAELGIDYVHINGEFWMNNEQRVDEMLAKAGLRVGAADGFFGLTQGKEMDKAEELIRFMSRKGVEQLLLIPGFVHEAQSRQSAMDEAAKHMKHLVYLARSMHVQCSLEDFDNTSAPFGMWQELKWYMEQIPELRISFDTGNFAYFAQDAMEAYEQLAPYVCLVHLKDRKYEGRPGEKELAAVNGVKLFPSAVGSGEMPMGELIARLKADGFDGCMTIEHFDSADMMADMRQSIHWLKEQLNM